jgi:hypothetical protein
MRSPTRAGCGRALEITLVHRHGILRVHHAGPWDHGLSHHNETAGQQQTFRPLVDIIDSVPRKALKFAGHHHEISPATLCLARNRIGTSSSSVLFAEFGHASVHPSKSQRRCGQIATISKLVLYRLTPSRSCEYARPIYYCRVRIVAEVTD